MKRIFLYTIILICIVSVVIVSCKNDAKINGTNSEPENTETVLPLNISVYLDLSDRLTREMTPSQMERDTAIINHLIDIFVNDCINNGKILNSNNHFQVFFYPAPNSSDIAQLAKGLNIDLSKTQLKQKKTELKEMKSRFQTNLSQIYADAINDSKWVGSDIWGFFSNKEVDKLCIREGYRNILVILTDGYIFHEGNKLKDGNAYSYILPQTLANPDASLIVKRNGLSDLEILLLEVNPYDLKQRNAIITTLEKWFKEMGVDHNVVNETALPITTETYINSFINYK